MIRYRPTADDLELRRRTHARLLQARVDMRSTWLLHPDNRLERKRETRSHQW